MLNWRTFGKNVVYTIWTPHLHLVSQSKHLVLPILRRLKFKHSRRLKKEYSFLNKSVHWFITVPLYFHSYIHKNKSQMCFLKLLTAIPINRYRWCLLWLTRFCAAPLIHSGFIHVIRGWEPLKGRFYTSAYGSEVMKMIGILKYIFEASYFLHLYQWRSYIL